MSFQRHRGCTCEKVCRSRRLREIKEIERRMGLARNTIKAWLRKHQMVEPKCPARVVARKLSGYTDTLVTWLKANAYRGKRERRTILSMHEELVGPGYGGSYGRVAAFARSWRNQQAASAGKAVFMPLKFALGESFQFDWSAKYSWVRGLRRLLEVARKQSLASSSSP
ncbi:MAG: hypothetical protein H7274_05870 [Rhodoferax sp.]|nr:hypothetical protein [Rhodoferax sp.]